MRWLLLWAAMTLVCAALYRPALCGPFISDDVLYIVANPWANLRPATIAALFDPTGQARHHAANYAPLHMLAHAVEAEAFGASTLPYHLVNVALHAANAALLVALLVQAAVPPAAAVLAGALFAVHPANVESVAWISQLKSLGALAGALLALWLFARRPLASGLAFAAALLFKASAGFALPMALALAWCRRAPRRSWLALFAWALVFALYSAVQGDTFGSRGGLHENPYASAWIHFRSMVAIGARYLAMAASGFGASAFHEPEPVISNLDPWWLLGLVATPFFLWRIASGLRARREEAAWWIGAAAAFAPISQLVPFYFGMGDRYLYFVLPGLLGGTLLLARPALDRWLFDSPHARARIAGLAALVLLFVLGSHASGRAGLWQSEVRLELDAASQYPHGSTAHWVRAMQALEAGETERVLEELRGAIARGHHLVHAYEIDPRLTVLRGEPGFEALLDDIARREIARLDTLGPATQREWRALANAYIRLEQLEDAEQALAEGIRVGGPADDLLIRLHTEVRRKLAQQHRGDS